MRLVTQESADCALRSLQPSVRAAVLDMPNRTASLPPGEPDPALLEKLGVLQQACLLVVALMALTIFASWLFPQIATFLPAAMTRMSVPMSLTVLLCALSLALSEPGNHLSLPRASRYICCSGRPAGGSHPAGIDVSTFSRGGHPARSGSGARKYRSAAGTFARQRLPC